MDDLAAEELMKELLLGNIYASSEMTFKFWDAPDTILWFREHGYTLYSRVIGEGYDTLYTIPRLPFEEVLECHYPYAGYDTTSKVYENPKPLCTMDYTGKIVYAQDSQQRHVAIKIMFEDSDECHISHFLSKQSLQTMRDNCIIPVLEVLTYKDGFSFAVMPRWGDTSQVQAPSTTREVLDIIQSLLKALVYLHDHNIIHRDVKMSNVLINHFRDDSTEDVDVTQMKLRSEGKLLYAMIDFDISIMAPADANRKQFTLPYFESWAGTRGCCTYDTAQGEHEYNPFVYDVGSTGVAFHTMFEARERYIPILAPLIDMMTTRNLRRRFTPEEALHFVEEFRRPLTEDELDTKHIGLPRLRHRFDKYDRWSAIPQDLQERWATYRESPTPTYINVLRRLNDDIGEYVSPRIMPSIWWFFTKFTSIPRSGWTCLVGLNKPLVNLCSRGIKLR